MVESKLTIFFLFDKAMTSWYLRIPMSCGGLTDSDSSSRRINSASALPDAAKETMPYWGADNPFASLSGR